MIINKEGKENAFDKGMDNELECPHCKCKFSFKEEDVEVAVRGIPYKTGIKKILKINEDYIVHKYITCPWCRSRLRLKYTIV